MTKNEIIDAVICQTDLPRSQALKAFEGILESIKQSLVKGEDVTLRGFATLKVVRTKDRVSCLHGKQTAIPAMNTVKIKISTELKKRMNHE
jgi:DNA-binding protein HU